MQIQEVIKDIDIVHVSGNLSGDVSAICYNSRNCERNNLFVAVCGLKSDGHDYIPEAIAMGATFIVHEKDYISPPGITAIKVPDSRRALGILGKNFYNNPSAHLCLIGVTGTNGKTTITYLLESILKAAGFSTGVLGTVNYRFNETVLPAPNTTPESYEMQKILRNMADVGITHVIAEVASHAVDLRRVDDCAFDIGIFTNLTQDHLDYHRTMENYFQAKKRFFDEIIPAGKKYREYGMIVNVDDPWGQRLVNEAKTGLSSRTYGIENKCDVTVDQFALSLEGITAEVNTGQSHFTLSSSLIGKFNLYNILAAVTASLSIKLSERHIRTGIENVRQVPGRLEKVSVAGEPAIFVDYAHTDDALRRVLQNLSTFKKRRVITVFGCGGDRDRGKRPLMGDAAATLSDLAILTSDNPRTEDPLSIIGEIETGISRNSVKKYLPEELEKNSNEKGYVVIPDRRKAIETAVALADISDIILIAGKGHENYQIIGNNRIPFDDRHVAREAMMNKQRGEKR